MKSGSSTVRTLLRRAKLLQPAAEEYLALLNALQDVIDLSGGGECSPCSEDEEDSIRTMSTDAKDLLR